MGKPRPNKYRTLRTNSKRSKARRRRDKNRLATLDMNVITQEEESSLRMDESEAVPDFPEEDDELLRSIISTPECPSTSEDITSPLPGNQTITVMSISNCTPQNSSLEKVSSGSTDQDCPPALHTDIAEDLPPLLHEKAPIPKEPPSSRVFCDLLHLIEEARKLEHHGFDCSGRFFCTKIVKCGLITKVYFQCSNILCSQTTHISTEKACSGINNLAVLGALATGSGFSQEEEKFAAMGVKYMSQPMFAKCETNAGKIVSSCTEEVLKESIEEEKRLALTKGSVDSKGYVCITAIVDGGWCKRSYGHGYNASSGVAVVLGATTQKILFIGVRNKLCLVCNAIQKGKMESKEHVCFKNWTGASTAMEPDIVVEGLNYLEKIHNVRCTKLIGDGDSNVMSAVIEKVPFGRLVQKLECANHAVRRYSRALEKLSKDTSRFRGKEGVEGRKLLSARTARLVIGARSCIKKHAVPFHEVPSSEKLEELRKELRNGPSHVFGKHTNCGDWCNRKENDPDGGVYATVSACGLLSAIERCVNQLLVCDAKTLIFNATNNPAEHFMSQLAKTYGGKRVDHSRAGGVIRRSALAALAYQAKGQKWHENVHRGLTGKSPNTPLRKLIIKRSRKHLNRLRARKLFKSTSKKVRVSSKQKDHVAHGGDQNYGDNPAVPDISEHEMKEQCSNFLSQLAVARQDELEQATLGQADNDRWREERLKRLSSTQFKKVSGRRPYTRTQNLIKSILYSRTTSKTAAMLHGAESESTARLKYIQVCGHEDNVTTCGLFVDPAHPYLCTSPDALIGQNGLLEIKCPFSALKYPTIKETVLKHNIGLKISKETNQLYLPETHGYFYQIQGQLAITDRSWCDLFVWSPTDYVIIRVQRNKAFWEKIFPALSVFYLDALLPELVDPRVTRGLPTRELKSVLEAINKKNDDVAKKLQKQSSSELDPTQPVRKKSKKM